MPTRQHPDYTLNCEVDAPVLAGAVAAGARGFLRWETVLFEPCSRMLRTPEVPQQVRRKPELTNRENQVLQRMSHGHSNGEIGQELGVSEDTIRTHPRRLYAKFEVHDRAAAVAHGFRHGLLT